MYVFKPKKKQNKFCNKEVVSLLILMKRSFYSSFIFAVSALFGCSEPINPPFCRAQIAIDTVNSEKHQCLLVQQNNAVLLVTKQKKFFSPSISHFELNPQHADNPHCGLHAKVWELSGINVNIEAVLSYSKSLTLYRCEIDNDLTIAITPIPLPNWREDKIATHATTKDLFKISRKELLYPEDLIPLREAYIKTNKEHSP